MTFQQCLFTLLARRNLVLWIFLGTVMTVLVVSMILPKQYTASATVVVDVKSPDPIAGMVLPGLMAPGYMATQVDIINSDRVAQRVVKKLRMDENPVFKEEWMEATDGRGEIDAWLANLLQEKLDVKPFRASNVIEIKFTGAEPAFAAAVANAFAESYIDTNIELRVEPAKQYAAWFDGQIKVQRERLEAVQKVLSDYQQATGIVAADEHLDYETQKLNELSAQLTQAEAQGSDASSKQKSGGMETLPEVMQHPLVNQLKGDVARLESKLKEQAGNIGINHPQYQRSAAELTELKARLHEAMAKVSSAVGTVGKISKQKESEVIAAIEAQKKKVLNLKKQRDEISVLLREVDAAQKGFDAVNQRMTQSKLESQSIQTNISVLTPASEPLEPSQPMILLNMLVAIFLGPLLGVGAVLAMEFMQRRVRSAEDLMLALDLPVLIELDYTAPLQASKKQSYWRDRLTRILFNKQTVIVKA